jgi:hypothetical protein
VSCATGVGLAPGLLILGTSLFGIGVGLFGGTLSGAVVGAF